MSTSKRVGQNVRTVARAREISMKELSKRMEFRNVQVLYTRLSGESKMSVEELERLARILSVTVELLLSDPSTLVGTSSAWNTTVADHARRKAA